MWRDRRPITISSEVQSRIRSGELEILSRTGLPYCEGLEIFDPLQNLSGLTDKVPSLFRFAESGPFSWFALGSRSGAVLETFEHGSPPVFVNSSLDHYCRCVDLFISSIPFVPYNEDGVDLTTAAREFLNKLRGIDAPAAEDGSFWCETAYDIEMGDWSSGAQAHRF